MALVKISEMAKKVNHSIGGLSAVNRNLCSHLIATVLICVGESLFSGGYFVINT